MPTEEESDDFAISDSPVNASPPPVLVTTRKPAQSVRILVVQEQTIFRDSLRALLQSEPGFRVVGEAADASAAIALARRLKPDVLLLDVSMAGTGGMEVIRELGPSQAELRVVVLSAALGKADTVRAFRLGARAVVFKNSSGDQLLDAIKTVMQGGYSITNESLANLIQALTDNSAGKRKFQNKYGLTRREIDVLTAVLDGYSNPEIAKEFRLSQQTVKHHLSHIFDKLGVYSRLELALFAVNHKILEDVGKPSLD